MAAKRNQKQKQKSREPRHSTITTTNVDSEALKPGFVGKPKVLPNEFKRASDITCQEHEYEIGRLRNMLQMKVVVTELNGKTYYIIADPLNDKYKLSDRIPNES
jgi:predicted alternative tryptophan synthase beta-subunit